MATKLEKKTNLVKQFKDICESLIDDAQEALQHGNKAQGVHNARKRFKQLRGVLRLIRFGLETRFMIARMMHCATQDVRFQKCVMRM